MIGKLKGVVDSIEEEALVLDVNGVGYLVSASARTLYDDWGDYVPWTAVGIVVLAALVMFARRRGFLGKRAGAGAGHAAQCVAGQSVPN